MMRKMGQLAALVVVLMAAMVPTALAQPVAGAMAPVVSSISTTKPVVFITIDDGIVRDPAARDLMRQSNTHPTLFLTQQYVQGHEDYFRQLQQAGASIENHTIDHPDLKGKPLDFQRQEICATSDSYATVFGSRPVLFRPPYGNYDDTTRVAAADCGIKYMVNWTATVNDGAVQFQTGNSLKPGDIVLMHFRTTFTQDYTAFLNKAREAGLTPATLTDFLG